MISHKKITGQAIFKYLILITICIFMTGCAGLQVNIPVEVQLVKREESALLVLVENKSTRQIKITYLDDFENL